jgi:hypothetical protein
VLDVLRLDGHEPVAVSGSEPNVTDGAVRIVGYGADRVQPACANASTGAISIRRTTPQKTAREVRLIIGCAAGVEHPARQAAVGTRRRNTDKVAVSTTIRSLWCIRGRIGHLRIHRHRTIAGGQSP